MDIRFSIGLPAFKGKFLNKAISSVLNQTFDNFELIIVNDCSPDPVNEIVSQFNDQRIRYFENEKNIGSESVIKNWNRCLNKANGEYFILMGDDDVMENNYLEKFNHLIARFPDSDVYHCRVKLINENSEVYGLSPICPEFESVYDNIWHRIKGYRLQYISDFVYKTEKLKNNNGFYELPLAWYSDDVSSFIAATEKGIAYTAEPLLKFRRSPISISSSGNPEKKIEALNLFSEWLNTFLKNEPNDLKDKLIWQSIKNYFPKHKQENTIEILYESYKREGFLKLFHWVRKKRGYNIRNRELTLSVIRFFKYMTSRFLLKMKNYEDFQPY